MCSIYQKTLGQHMYYVIWSVLELFIVPEASDFFQDQQKNAGQDKQMI